MTGGRQDRCTVTREVFEEWTRPRLMLFLSADIEHSTLLTQRSVTSGEWLPHVFEFISSFPTSWQNSREVLALTHSRPAPRSWNPWKVLGDEVIFALEMTDEHQPGRELTAFSQTLREWNTTPDRRTSIKGAAWLAGFPVANTPIPVLSLSGGLEADYIGPSMDAGFRLAKASTSRRLVLSVELAWWLLRHPVPDHDPLPIHFLGCWPHKGLAEETGYPLLWLGINPPRFQQQEDELLGRGNPGSVEKLRELCRNFIEEFGVPAQLPFLYSPSSLPAGPEILQFEERLRKAKTLMREVLLEVGDPDEISAIPVSEQNAAAESLSRQIAELSSPGPDK